MPRIFTVTLKFSQKTYRNGCKRQNNGSILLTTTLLMHRNCNYHFSLAANGWDGNGLQLEKIGQFFQDPGMYPGEMAVKLL